MSTTNTINTMDTNTMTQTLANLNNLIMNTQNTQKCDADCQKQKELALLKTKYLEAQNNVKNAPKELSIAKKNYYSYSEGSSEYQQSLENELNEKATQIALNIQNTFEEKINELEKLNEQYNVLFINSQNSVQLYFNKKKENVVLQKTNELTKDEIAKNDRKTYYEEQSINSLQFWSYLLWFVYYILLVVYVVFIFIKRENIIFKSILSVFLFFYPFLFYFVLQKLINVFVYVKNYFLPVYR